MKFEINKRNGRFTPKQEPADLCETSRQYSFIKSRALKILKTQFGEFYNVKAVRHSITVSIKGVRRLHHLNDFRITSYFNRCRFEMEKNGIPEDVWRKYFLTPKLLNSLDALICDFVIESDVIAEEIHYPSVVRDIVNYKKKRAIDLMKKASVER